MTKFATIKYRAHNNYDVEQASDEVAYHETMPSLTVQSQAEDADINVLMERYGVTGKMPENPRVPVYGDFTGVKDYQSALESVIQADAAFGELPAAVRAKFDNDPQKLLEFVNNDANIEAARTMGLLKPLTPQQIQAQEAKANAGTNQNAGKPDQAAAGGTPQVGTAAGGSSASK